MPEDRVDDPESEICINYSRSQGAFQAGCMIIATVVLLPVFVIWGCLLVEIEPLGKLLLLVIGGGFLSLLAYRITSGVYRVASKSPRLILRRDALYDATSGQWISYDSIARVDGVYCDTIGPKISEIKVDPYLVAVELTLFGGGKVSIDISELEQPATWVFQEIVTRTGDV